MTYMDYFINKRSIKKYTTSILDSREAYVKIYREFQLSCPRAQKLTNSACVGLSGDTVCVIAHYNWEAGTDTDFLASSYQKWTSGGFSSLVECIQFNEVFICNTFTNHRSWENWSRNFCKKQSPLQQCHVQQQYTQWKIFELQVQRCLKNKRENLYFSPIRYCLHITR